MFTMTLYFKNLIIYDFIHKDFLFSSVCLAYCIHRSVREMSEGIYGWERKDDVGILHYLGVADERRDATVTLVVGQMLDERKMMSACYGGRNVVNASRPAGNDGDAVKGADVPQ